MTYCHFLYSVEGGIPENPEEFQKLLDGSSAFVDENESSVEIDKDHLEKNPECGYLPPKSTSSAASSRISNAAESDQHFPWMISITRMNKHILGGEEIELCAGTIISQTTAVTSAKCICGAGSFEIADDLKHHVDCIGGNPEWSNPLNEVRDGENYNKLIAGVGSKDRTKLRKIPILVAYVMGNPWQNPQNLSSMLGVVEDIGLVMTKDMKTLEGSYFYDQKSNIAAMKNKGEIKVGSLCLAAAIQNPKEDREGHSIYMYDGKATFAGWGLRAERDTVPGSCTTNEFGPRPSRFKHCTARSLSSNPYSFGCNYYDLAIGASEFANTPEGYDDKECIKYLNRADEAIRKKSAKLLQKLGSEDQGIILSDLWEITNIIKVKSSSLQPPWFQDLKQVIPEKMNEKIGQKTKDIKHDQEQTHMIQNLERPGSYLYPEEQRQLPTKKSFTCYKKELFNQHGWCYTDDSDVNAWGFCSSSCDLLNTYDNAPSVYHKMVWKYPPRRPCRCKRPFPNGINYQNHYLCICTLVPQPFFMDFKRDGIGRLKFLDVTKEDSVGVRISGVQLPCHGDGGSGHWMHDSKENKKALVAVHSFNSDTYCGDDSYEISTVHPRILEWIKRHGNIRKLGRRHTL